MKHILRAVAVCFFLITLLTNSVHSQQYRFQQYGINKGICYQFVYDVIQDKDGFVWALTGTGLCRYDGFLFKSDFQDSLPKLSATAAFKDKEQNLWFGFSDGTIASYNGRVFTIFQPDSLQSGSINDITQDAQDNIIAITQSSGIIVIDKNAKKTLVTLPFAGKLLYSLVITGNELLIGSDDGVNIYSYSSDLSKIQFVKQIEGLPLSKVQCIVKNKETNSYWVCTEDAGFLLLDKIAEQRYSSRNFSDSIGLQSDNIQSITVDNFNNIWVATFGKGLFKVSLSNDLSIKGIVHYNSTNGLGINDIKTVYPDREGNIWVSTFGNGLAMLLTESFISYDFSNYFKGKNITAVCFDKDGYWVGGDKGLLKITNGVQQNVKFIGLANGLPSDLVTTLYLLDNGTLIIGTSKSGVYQLKKDATRIVSLFQMENTIANSINAITGLGNTLYFSTNDGVYEYDYEKGTYIQNSTDKGKHLPHNNIKQVYIDSKSRAWVATQSSMLFTLNTSDKFVSKGAHELEFTAITKGENGSIWAGTNGNGVLKFGKDTVVHFSSRENLMSDYCYAMATDNSDNIWIGHRLGLSRISGAMPHQIKIYGSEFINGDINPNAIAVGPSGDILFGTTEGLILYQSSLAGGKPVSPLVNITSVTIDEKNYDWTKKIVLGYGRHKLRVDFIGLNYNNPDQVIYQYKLEGYDLEWTETKETFARFIVTDGSYTLKLRARNGDGVWTEKDVTFDLKIRKPFWKTWWFIIMALTILVATVFIIIKIREKKQKEFQIYLERLLDERTKEVREQKEEIELKNRDITDSINYAQRIQASILPSLRRLQQYFTGSFVYYQPRDIVSGDFYWFDVIPNTNKFIIVCADSTGHGVPGAFMSLIGTTLLKDIFNRTDVQKPSDILQHLDNELKSTLNQNLEGERPNDGMDIIVCEIDISTNMARFSSAMRPFIIYQNGEQLYFKGSRSSIGGQVKEEKVFDDVEIQLTKGDLIYMFSDGYPDQFGGPHGKKFKMVRLRNLLKDIHQKPMEEQYNYVKSNFELWQGGLEQVDDVIFMGIKI